MSPYSWVIKAEYQSIFLFIWKVPRVQLAWHRRTHTSWCDVRVIYHDIIWTAWHPLAHAHELARGAVRRSSLLENCQVKWKWMHRIDIVIHLKYLNLTRVSYCVEECFKPATVAFYQKFCVDPPYHDVSDWRGDGGNSNFTATHHHIKRSNGHAATCQGRKQSQGERFRVGAITNTRPMVWYNCYL